MRIRGALLPFVLLSISLIIFFTACARKETVSKAGPAQKAAVTVNWDKVVTVSKTTPDVSSCGQPSLAPGFKDSRPGLSSCA